MYRKPLSIALISTLLTLNACGGGGDASSPLTDAINVVQPIATPTLITNNPTIPNPTGPGQFFSIEKISSISLPNIQAALAEKNIPLSPKYWVDNYKIVYMTNDKNGQMIKASGLIAVPRKPAGQPSPILAYQHATIKQDAEAPSNHATADELVVILASLGYIAQATDYVGYGASLGAEHPYLLSKPSASAVLDFLEASRRWRLMQQLADNKQLFFGGYSEGAYATMATLKELSTKPNPHFAPTLSVLGAGPYKVSLTLDLFITEIAKRNAYLGILLNPGFMSQLSDTDRKNVRAALLNTFIGTSSDVTFSGAFLDHYFSNDTQSVQLLSDVTDWTPSAPLVLFHGKDDVTVPYANTLSALSSFSGKSSASAPIKSIDCQVSPADHIACVPEFIMTMILNTKELAKDL